VFDVGVDYVVGAWSKACALAGITDLRIHDARHEAISRTAETSAFELTDLQQFSGHRDLRMLMRYSHLCASKLAKKLDEAYKDSTKVRVHRGRKYLNQKAGLPPSSVTVVTDESAATTSPPGTDAVAASAQPSTPCEHSQASLIAAAELLVDRSVETSARETLCEPGATVIAFPASRIVRGANGEESATMPRPESVSQAPRGG